MAYPLRNEDKQFFVIDLVTSVMDRIVDDIKMNKVPEEWDGIELRQLVADRFEREVYKAGFNRSRRIAYNNSVRVNNL